MAMSVVSFHPGAGQALTLHFSADDKKKGEGGGTKKKKK